MLGVVSALVSCKRAEEKVKEEAAYVIGMEEYVRASIFASDLRISPFERRAHSNGSR